MQGAVLDLDYSSENEREITAIEQAILPETRSKIKCTLKAKVTRNRGSNHLLLHFAANDVVSLRASTNTNLRLVSSAAKALNAVRK